ncbi:macrophage-expressed gene 1 protein-like [Pomacea canaliculata]|uniref:macrophage-expressed gene 1 protein-like n=1 Tax=Pomacea canaliculata TaxID=400727 RepID=UPI000D73FFBA|nr:macrophage-expressed gene 1 protein-like [Pomacea canaliculata]XP_025107633.1 macrophage-expressed gene 1 protein-like [Pomacea canaliculata]
MHVLSTFLLAIGIASVLCLLPVLTAGSPITEDVGDNRDEDKIVTSHYPVGDARRCLQESAQNYFRMERFEVLPGNGWDNLQNEPQVQIVAFNYSQCRTTDDGRFLLPDTVTTVPIKSTDLQLFSDLISNTEEWTSVTSRSINLDAGLDNKFISISGKYSSEFTDMKSKMISDKTVVVRTEARYVRYSVHLQPDTPLHPTFRSHLLQVAAAHEREDEESARYLAELLVRDFGTHVITSVKAGAAIAQVDHLKEEWMKKNSEQKNEILASASFSLFKLNLSASVSFKSKTESSYQSGYLSQRTSSVVRTYGGPVYKPINFTINEWAEAADRDLVALDQTGDPLHYLITAAMLPECSASILSQVQSSIQQAVETYYDYNVHQGCLLPDSDYFTPSANFDDGTCKPPTSNFTFGGMYQNCTVWRLDIYNQHICYDKTQLNPLTGSLSCPSGYQPVRIQEIGWCNIGMVSGNCNLCPICYISITTYWCTAWDSAKVVPSNHGYLFGGLYTSSVSNPVTGSPSCPSDFFALRVGYTRDLHVCVSADLEFGAKGAVPFAGFVSCLTGNPLAIPGDRMNSKGDEWPQRCPEGYSMHLATVDLDCQLNYCVLTRAMRGNVTPPLERPPFVPPPAGIFWDEKEINHTDDRSSQSLSPGAAAGIGVGVTLGIVLLVIIVYQLHGRCRRTQSRYSSMTEPVAAGASPPGYGASHVSSNL